MTTVLDIAREYFPSFDDDTLDMFLWEFTSYPFLKHQDKEGHLREQLLELREQLLELRDSIWWDVEADMFPY